jgi:hypothetical protein
MSDLFNICCRYTALEEKFSTCNHSDDLYRKCLDELSEIVAKYDFCNIVLAGDLNASFIRPKPTIIDQLFMEDIVVMSLMNLPETGS